MKSKLLQSILALFLITSSLFAQERTQVQVLSAVVKDQKIQGAEVIFQRNGETSVKAITDASGKISIPKVFNGIDDNSVTLIIKKPGYSTLVTKGPVNNLTYALSPVMSQLDGLRVVLSWGRNPLDLDSHISYPGNHVCYHSKTGVMANLDVDDTDSFGPETITIERKQPGQKYIYAVHNYSDRETRNNIILSNISDARVYVYIGNTLIRSYKVPRNKAGNTWVVFLIDENGSFEDINKFYDSPSPQAVGRQMDVLRGRNDLTERSAVRQSDIQDSNYINKEGEAAYHAKRYADAVEYYQRAIELNPDNGQAYSNLGLAFQRMNREAEAIWANRKAINLAHGNSVNVVKASSFYNIGRIYESKSQWADALDNFEKALSLNQNTVYVNAIARMKAKLGR